MYYALHNGPGWNNTLLVITYDEHGGNFDHVPPPSTAVPPDDSAGEFGFDFTRFGVRIPALLVSPRIVAGTVFRAEKGTIDHTSVLKTIELRWDISPLTERDKAAPDLGNVLTLKTPRTDDPLSGVRVPVSHAFQPNLSTPSLIEKIHAWKVANLPLRNDQGMYDQHTPPDLSTSEAIGDYIQARTAAWKEHLHRLRQRRAAQASVQKPSQGCQEGSQVSWSCRRVRGAGDRSYRQIVRRERKERNGRAERRCRRERTKRKIRVAWPSLVFSALPFSFQQVARSLRIGRHGRHAPMRSRHDENEPRGLNSMLPDLDVKSARLRSLDAYRGFVMLAMASGGAGALAGFVDHGDGASSHILQWLRQQLDHVPWRGGVFWDMIQPSFMFMVGVAMPFSFASRTARGETWTRMFGHALVRSMVLVALAVFLASNGSRYTHYSFVNVLGQIGLGYTFVFLLLGRRPARPARRRCRDSGRGLATVRPLSTGRLGISHSPSTASATRRL